MAIELLDRGLEAAEHIVRAKVGCSDLRSGERAVQRQSLELIRAIVLHVPLRTDGLVDPIAGHDRKVRGLFPQSAMPKTEELLVVSQQVQYCGQNIDLLCYTDLIQGFDRAWCEVEERHPIVRGPVVRLAGPVDVSSMVRRDNEKCVRIPGHAARSFEELPKGIVGISQRRVNVLRAARELFLLLRW